MVNETSAVSFNQKKKEIYPVSEAFKQYLIRNNRAMLFPISYQTLLGYQWDIPLLNSKDEDTLWLTVKYNDYSESEIHQSLCQIYSLLKTMDKKGSIKHLEILRVDFCTFGNSKPFRIKIQNVLTDNIDYFYVKQADASRIYGLELEDMLSPNKVNFLVDRKTLVEEHISGIPADVFFHQLHSLDHLNQTRVCKEYIKFNERCFVRLLGDMRSYNFVIVIIPDIDGNQYRFRAIDFDQQSYEGNKDFYLPNFFKENSIINTLSKSLMEETIIQEYKKEERAFVYRRALNNYNRIKKLFECFKADILTTKENLSKLKKQLAIYHQKEVFNTFTSMGMLVQKHIEELAIPTEKK